MIGLDIVCDHLRSPFFRFHLGLVTHNRHVCDRLPNFERKNPRKMKRILTIERLEEFFTTNEGKPITVRHLSRCLRASREEIFSFLQKNPNLFGAAIRRPVHGGSKSSTVIFLRSNPPPGLRPPKPKPLIVTTKISWRPLQ